MQDGLSNHDKIKVEMAFQAKEVQLHDKEEEVNLLKGKVQQLQQIVIEKNIQYSGLLKEKLKEQKKQKAGELKFKIQQQKMAQQNALIK